MKNIEFEPLKSHDEEVRDTVSNALVADGKSGNDEKATGEEEGKSIEFIPESDTKIYTLSYRREYATILG